jgi:transcriptional regulator with XRE-family HTH domain
MGTRGRKLTKTVHSEGQAAFRELMTRARKAAGLTQQELATKLGKPQSFVAKYEAGERRIDVIEFIAISREISVDSAGLLKKLIKHV